ncbi:MAG: VWA domain-containing protein, partial [Blastocatellia bacterium]
QLPRTQIMSEADRDVLRPEIDKLVANGAWTHTGAALTEALNQVYSRPDKQRPAAIILLTDGHEDVKGIKNPIRIPDAISLIRDQDVPYVFYVSLGTDVDRQLQRFLDRIKNEAQDQSRADTFKDPRAEKLPQEADEIRKKVYNRPPPPPPPPPPFKLTVEPDDLNLGNIEPASSRNPYPIRVSSTRRTNLTLSIMGVPPGHVIEGLPDTLEVGPERIEKIDLKVRLGEDAREGSERYTLRIVPDFDQIPREIPIAVTVSWTNSGRVRYFLSKHRYWLLLLLLLLLLCAYFFKKWFFDDMTPLEVIRSWFESGRPRRRTAVLDTPEGVIRLDRPLTLGEGGANLRTSPATIDIRPEGGAHYLAVRKGSVTLVDETGLSETVLEPHEERRLMHKQRLKIPGYHKLSVYLNAARRRR